MLITIVLDSSNGSNDISIPSATVLYSNNEQHVVSVTTVAMKL
jgi:hypothetical protein